MRSLAVFAPLRRIAASSILAGSVALVATVELSFAQEEQGGVFVTVDQAVIMRLSAPAGAIVVGNTTIADATIMDASTLVITGHNYGTTNIIVLDVGGNIIADELITVQSAEDQVSVYRRSVRQTYSCTPICQPTLNVGDSEQQFQNTNEQIQARAALSF